ncbi:MAG: adenylate/guanylate cyclase domain-containing protein [Betaproteobacteria bacterium]|nr:adenylate/guanylate cyclase domain-containing protein [Betaproteobacteria bacterium]
MEQARQTTVLFADVSGVAKPYESERDPASAEAIAGCLELLRQTVESHGGRVVKTIGDKVMAAFATPDAAANAAASAQYAVDALHAAGDTKLGVRIGFHFGPVIQRDNDVFGDTVNLAARLTELAARNQIITVQETAERLAPLCRNFMRRLYAIHVKGKAEDVELCEFVWHQADDVTVFETNRTKAKLAPVTLRLKHRDREIIRRRENDSIIIGRDQGCGLVVAEDMASRQHCTIERRQNNFVLTDRSANGTFVTVEGDTEIRLRREGFTLRKHGWISFGQPRAQAKELVEYFCEENPETMAD